jgi:hypothetical protein
MAGLRKFRLIAALKGEYLRDDLMNEFIYLKRAIFFKVELGLRHRLFKLS